MVEAYLNEGAACATTFREFRHRENDSKRKMIFNNMELQVLEGEENKRIVEPLERAKRKYLRESQCEKNKRNSRLNYTKPRKGLEGK